VAKKGGRGVGCGSVLLNKLPCLLSSSRFCGSGEIVGDVCRASNDGGCEVV
jgi:hypothetical protein